LGAVVAACARIVAKVGLQGWCRLWFTACGDSRQNYGMVGVFGGAVRCKRGAMVSLLAMGEGWAMTA